MAEVKNYDNPTLEALLKEVDFVFLQDNYIPSSAAIKIINFIKLVNGEEGEEL